MLELVDLPEPEPGPGELLVEVLVSPVAPIDRLTIRGLYPLPAPNGIPGAEGVGRVIGHGPGVMAPSVGARVLLPVRIGAWRQRLTMPADQAVVVPDARRSEDACTLRIEGLSAAVLLEELAPGEWFMHSPGAGAVGRYLTVLARMRGLHSIALIGSPEPIAELWGLGADHVFVREPGLSRRVFELGLAAPRIAFDGSGGEVTDQLASMLEPGGEVVVYGAMTRRAPQISIDQLLARGVRLRGFWLHRWAQAAGNHYVQALLQELLELDLRERIASTHSLEDWRSAIERAGKGAQRGRVLLRPTD